MVRAEALTRWTSSQLGRMSPDRFIPIAESSGLIVPLGKSLMNQVCTDLRAWSDLEVSVNLSPAQLRDPNFMTETAGIIAQHGVQASRIEFELTEGIFVDDPASAGAKLAQLREMGHSIALDDFGTGFSSIGYLRRIKFDKLKIDKTFIDDLGTTPNAEDLLRSLALLAKSYNLQIVAEGVERESQYETLYELGYDFIQGHYCGKAMTFFDLFSIFTGQLTKIQIEPAEIVKAS
jgi:EAL domain-containing protein (putative c-di-GMP-specific phosphodiesterase class I)